MLNKDICAKCLLEFWGCGMLDGVADDIEHGRIPCCPARRNRTSAPPLSVSAEAPEHCPYIVEHVVSEDQVDASE